MAELLRDLDAPNVGMCLDVGHWMSFGEGSKKKNLRHWIDCLAPWLKHLHLHDNDGSSDHHAGMGKGEFPWPDFFSLLDEYGLRPGFTLEPHTVESFNDSREFIADNASWFKLLATN
jgi:sugar phosphate isomerase/epimerase